MNMQEASILKKIYQRNLLEKRNFLSKKAVEIWIEDLFDWLFCTQEKCVDFQLFEDNKEELRISLVLFLGQVGAENPEQVADLFFDDLCLLHEILLSDLNAIVEFDPAAKSRNEVLLAYPGFFAIAVYRIANNLWNREVEILPRVLSEYVHSKTGIDIHPAASIGSQFFIDHGTGIVIGETAIIGNGVKIYQGVTLGALSVSKDKAEIKRHPTIEDNVIIYANASILGGKTTIGKNSVIGGNVWLTESIPEKSLVFHKSEIIVKTKIEFQDIINFSI
jgi:serine O-acetyltransferase